MRPILAIARNLSPLKGTASRQERQEMQYEKIVALVGYFYIPVAVCV